MFEARPPPEPREVMRFASDPSHASDPRVRGQREVREDSVELGRHDQVARPVFPEPPTPEKKTASTSAAHRELKRLFDRLGALRLREDCVQRALLGRAIHRDPQSALQLQRLPEAPPVRLQVFVQAVVDGHRRLSIVGSQRTPQAPGPFGFRHAAPQGPMAGAELPWLFPQVWALISLFGSAAPQAGHSGTSSPKTSSSNSFSQLEQRYS